MSGRPAVGPSDPASRVAYWGLLGLVVLSLSVRPLISVLGLPTVSKNLDGLLVPIVALTVLILTLRNRAHTPLSRLLSWSLVTLGASTLLSWAAGTPRTLVSAGLGFVSVLVLPLAVFLAVHAVRYARGRVDLLVLQVTVLAEIAVGLRQYFHREVATHAPFRADLIDGTTSHNLWPAFALPASIVLALLDRGPRRIVWPTAVILLAIYAEAKAALLVWIPVLLVTVLVGEILQMKAHGVARYRMTSQRLISATIVVAGVAVLIAGLWYSPSVQGTWLVLRGHTSALEAFAGDTTPSAAPNPTLRNAVTTLDATVNHSLRTAVLGLGPANTVSHAAEVLAHSRADGSSLPHPGPVATSLLTDEGPLQFEDAQSSLLGLWGDLGALGAVLYAGVLGLALLYLSREVAGPRGASLIVLLALMLVTAPVAASFLLDWMEQASIVLPLALALVVLVRASRPTVDR